MNSPRSLSLKEDSMFFLRSARLEDLDDLFELGKLKKFYQSSSK